MAAKHTSNQSGSFLNDWLLPLIFLFALPPVGVLLIGAKLFSDAGAAKKKAQASTAEPKKPGARTTVSSAQRESARQAAADPLQPLLKKNKKLTTLGMVLTILFGFISLVTLTENLWMLPDVAWLMESLLYPLCMAVGGGALWWSTSRQRKKLRRFRQYLSTIGRRQTLSISSLASATGRTPAQVREDLQDMLDGGMFPEGFLDYGGDMLVLSADGLQEAPKKPKADPAQAENAILTEIRTLNQSISHPGLSAQIDRIGVITARIFEYQKAHPEKSHQLHSFLSYYLPTTLKILRAYAQLEAQGIEGENITAAKLRIEQMMDKVVDGFEKQLDQLFHDDALDITSDVKVLEQMLEKDGLSSGQPIRLSL